MNTNDQYALNWNNHSSHLRKAFDLLFTENEFVDVTLSCEGKKVKAHKMLLSACSQYFHGLFRDNPCQHPIVILKDVKFKNLINILQFMYNGEVSVSSEDFDSFLKTAELLQVSGLTNEQKNNDDDDLFSSENEACNTEDSKYNDNETSNLNSKNTRKRTISINNDYKETTIQKRPKESKTEANVIIKQEKFEVDNDDVNSVEILEPDEDTDTSEAAFTKSNQFISHYKPKRIHECSICSKQFSNTNNLKLHMASHTGATTCYICNGIYSRSHYLKKHLKVVHGIDS